mgnify:FL=1
MKAAVYERYGPPEVLSLRDLPTPQPKHGEVLIRVHAASVSSADWRARSLVMPRGFGAIGRLVFGWRRPRQPILGTELSGVIEAVGPGVEGVRPGDAVVAFPGARMGCHAEFRCLPAESVVPKPARLSHAQAAALCFGGVTMLDFFRRAGLKAGERVLVNGASGTVGSAAVQLARHAGAEVAAVCRGENAELARSLGADAVIDYTAQDPFAGGPRYDLIVDTVGNAPFSRSAGALRPGGRLLALVSSLPELLKSPWPGLVGDRRVIAGPAAERLADVQAICALAEAGHFTPVIDRVLPLAEVRAAHAHVDGGHKRGSVVLTMVAGQA